ncbi:hypothetical protein D3C77_292320 [compost metagenome]
MHIKLPYTKLLCRTLDGIHVFNFALNECSRELDGSYVPKVENPFHDWHILYFNDIKSNKFTFHAPPSEINYYESIYTS